MVEAILARQRDGCLALALPPFHCHPHPPPPNQFPVPYTDEPPYVHEVLPLVGSMDCAVGNTVGTLGELPYVPTVFPAVGSMDYAYQNNHGVVRCVGTPVGRSYPCSTARWPSRPRPPPNPPPCASHPHPTSAGTAAAPRFRHRHQFRSQIQFSME